MSETGAYAGADPTTRAEGPVEAGKWYGHGSTDCEEVRVSMAGGDLVLGFADGTQRRSGLREVTLSSRIKGVPLSVTFDDGSQLTIADGELALALARKKGKSRAAWFEHNIILLLPVLLLGSAAVIYMMVSFVVPAMAEFIVPRIDTVTVNSVGDRYFEILERVADLEPDGALPSLDEHGMAEEGRTQLDVHREFGELGRSMSALAGGDYDYEYFIDFGEDAGYNAYALPNGHIVMTEGLYASLTEDEAAAVIAHELVHVIERHGMKAAIRSSAWFVISALLLDPTLLVSLPALAELSYSRAEELEADCLAADMLARDGRDPYAIASALAKLHDKVGYEDGDGQDLGLYGWIGDKLSTHPQREERILHASGCAARAAGRA